MRSSLVEIALGVLLACFLFIQQVSAHLALWDYSVYGFNVIEVNVDKRGMLNQSLLQASSREPEHWYDDPWSSSFLGFPLRYAENYTFDQWWFHGVRGAKPKPGDVTQLSAGGVYTAEISCNKAYTKFQPSEYFDRVGNIPCMMNEDAQGYSRYGNDSNREANNGQLHAQDKDDAAGCGLAIAYKNDIYDVTQEDLVVFSVNHTCPWYRQTDFHIPADLPPCPNGKCICSWNWIHNGLRGEGYNFEMYMVGFDCNVVNTTSARKISKPKVAQACSDDPSKCIKGAKQGLYWCSAQPDGCNIPETSPNPLVPPTYNSLWGFADGAQNDIFEASDSSSTKTATTTSAMSTSTTKPQYCYLNDQSQEGAGVQLGSEGDESNMNECRATAGLSRSGGAVEMRLYQTRIPL